MEVFHGTAIRSVTCHMGSHSVTCYPTQVNTPRLNRAMQAGTRFTYPGGMEGWVDLIDLIAPRPGVKPSTFRLCVQRSTSATTKTTKWVSLNFVGLIKAVLSSPSLSSSGFQCCLLLLGPQLNKSVSKSDDQVQTWQAKEKSHRRGKRGSRESSCFPNKIGHSV